MGEVTVFECDVTGERFGARNDVVTIGVKRRWSHNPFRVHEYAVHLSDAAIEEHDVQIGQLQFLAYVAVEGRDIVGAATGEGSEYLERGNVLIESYEHVFEFLEEEVIV